MGPCAASVMASALHLQRISCVPASHPCVSPIPHLHRHSALYAAVYRSTSLLTYERLPQSGPKPAGITNPALAAAAFDAPDFISGNVRWHQMGEQSSESADASKGQHMDNALSTRSSSTTAAISLSPFLSVAVLLCR